MVNSIHVDLSQDDIRVVPAIADPVEKVQTIPEMAHDNFIAGVNGGYFWRVDIEGIWRDNVCRGKTRIEAEQNASDVNPNYGIGDGLVKIDGEVLANNCDCYGNSRPAVLILDGEASDIEVLYRGETVDSSVMNAIAAGPNLVSFNKETGESYVDIPSDDDNINRFVYEAFTAVGLQIKVDPNNNQATISDTLVMVTTDGSDSCLPHETYCGIFSIDLADMMREVFECGVAMSMDQGGSTTMWIDGENPERNGVVSRSDNKEQSEGARKLANGLFIEVLQK